MIVFHLEFNIMAFKFEELKVWQISLKPSNEIDITAKNFPRIELFSLSNQIKKSSKFCKS